MSAIALKLTRAASAVRGVPALTTREGRSSSMLPGRVRTTARHAAIAAVAPAGVAAIWYDLAAARLGTVSWQALLP